MTTPESKTSHKAVPATEAHFERVFGMSCPVAWDGVSIVDNQIVLAIGGVAVEEDGDLTAFLWACPKARKPWLFRHVAHYLKAAKTRGCGSVRAYCDTQIEKSDVFLQRLGFTKTHGIRNNMEVWIWQTR